MTGVAMRMQDQGRGWQPERPPKMADHRLVQAILSAPSAAALDRLLSSNPYEGLGFDDVLYNFYSPTSNRFLETAAVYVITAEDTAVKVGVSVNPGQRLAQLQTGQHLDLRIYWAMRLPRSAAGKLERAVHRFLRKTTKFGRGELYYVTPDYAVGVIEDEAKRMRFVGKPDFDYGRVANAGGFVG
jgi:predicted GIY-YIG superfamily endonuclease